MVNVTVHLASYNTRAATELTIRSLRRTAGVTPFDLVVGDGGSTDGSVAMLERLEARGWLTLERAPGGRLHWEWLDRWLASCPTRWAVFSDSDVWYRRVGWLDELLSVDAALVTPGLVGKGNPFYMHPITGGNGYLMERPEPWLFAVDVGQVRGLGSFDWYQEEREGRLMLFDTGARIFENLRTAGLDYRLVPALHGRFRHWGGLSWRKAGDKRLPLERRVKQAGKALAVRALLAVERYRLWR